MDFGHWLKVMRDVKGWTQSRLAQEADVSLFTVQKAEGSVAPNLSAPKLQKIAGAFDLTWEQMRARWESGEDIYGKPVLDEKLVPIIVHRTTADRIRAFAEARKMPVFDVFDLMLDALEQPAVKGSSSKTPKAKKPTSQTPPVPELPQSPANGGKA